MNERILCLILLYSLSSGVKFPNDVEALSPSSGQPEIECNEGNVKITVNTTNGVANRIFSKGHYTNIGCSFERTNTATFNIGACGMNRQRQLEPRGITYGVVVLVQLHPLFMTKVDRAYNLKCFYLETEKSVTSLLDVSMLSTQSVTNAPPMPVCTYELHSDSATGPSIRYARVGDPVWHVWNCPSTTFGVLVHSCYVSDGEGNEFQIIDQKGCGVDQYVMRTPEYSSDLTKVQQETHVFKFADKTALVFNCQIKLCDKSNNSCSGITPPECPKANITTGNETQGDHSTQTPSEVTSVETENTTSEIVPTEITQNVTSQNPSSETITSIEEELSTLWSGSTGSAALSSSVSSANASTSTIVPTEGTTSSTSPGATPGATPASAATTATSTSASSSSTSSYSSSTSSSGSASASASSSSSSSVSSSSTSSSVSSPAGGSTTVSSALSSSSTGPSASSTNASASTVGITEGTTSSAPPAATPASVVTTVSSTSAANGSSTTGGLQTVSSSFQSTVTSTASSANGSSTTGGTETVSVSSLSTATLSQSIVTSTASVNASSTTGGTGTVSSSSQSTTSLTSGLETSTTTITNQSTASLSTSTTTPALGYNASGYGEIIPLENTTTATTPESGYNLTYITESGDLLGEEQNMTIPSLGENITETNLTNLSSVERSSVALHLLLLHPVDGRGRRNVLAGVQQSDKKMEETALDAWSIPIRPDQRIRARLSDDPNDVETDVSQSMWVLEPEEKLPEEDHPEYAHHNHPLTSTEEESGPKEVHDVKSSAGVCVSMRTLLAIAIPASAFMIATIAALTILCIHRVRNDAALLTIRHRFPFVYMYKNE